VIHYLIQGWTSPGVVIRKYLLGEQLVGSKILSKALFSGCQKSDLKRDEKTFAQ